MAIYRGVLKRVGQGKWEDGKTTVSIFEIGDATLREVFYTDYMKNYVDDAIGHGGEVAVLLLQRKSVIAIKIGDRLYFDEQVTSPKFKRLAYFFIVFGIVALPFFLLGAPFIYLGVKMLMARQEIDREMPELEAMALA